MTVNSLAVPLDSFHNKRLDVIIKRGTSAPARDVTIPLGVG